MIGTHPGVDAIWDRADALRHFYLLDVAFAVITAGVMLASDDRRLSAPTFDTIRETGGRWVWGSLLAAVALALIAARSLSPTLLRAALWAAASMYALWAVSFVFAAIGSSDASLFGPGTFALIAVMHVAQTFYYRPQGGAARVTAAGGPEGVVP